MFELRKFSVLVMVAIVADLIQCSEGLRFTYAKINETKSNLENRRNETFRELFFREKAGVEDNRDQEQIPDLPNDSFKRITPGDRQRDMQIINMGTTHVGEELYEPTGSLVNKPEQAISKTAVNGSASNSLLPVPTSNVSTFKDENSRKVTSNKTVVDKSNREKGVPFFGEIDENLEDNEIDNAKKMEPGKHLKTPYRSDDEEDFDDDVYPPVNDFNEIETGDPNFFDDKSNNYEDLKLDYGDDEEEIDDIFSIDGCNSGKSAYYSPKFLAEWEEEEDDDEGESFEGFQPVQDDELEERLPQQNGDIKSHDDRSHSSRKTSKGPRFPTFEDYFRWGIKV